MRRYCLASDRDTAAGLTHSTGGVWRGGAVPSVGVPLMTGPEADAMLARHPGAVIVDVIVYRDMCAVWDSATKLLLPVERSTPELRARVRQAGREALRRAGYANAAAKLNPFNPCEEPTMRKD